MVLSLVHTYLSTQSVAAKRVEQQQYIEQLQSNVAELLQECEQLERRRHLRQRSLGSLLQEQNRMLAQQSSLQVLVNAEKRQVGTLVQQKFAIINSIDALVGRKSKLLDALEMLVSLYCISCSTNSLFNLSYQIAIETNRQLNKFPIDCRLRRRRALPSWRAGYAINIKISSRRLLLLSIVARVKPCGRMPTRCRPRFVSGWRTWMTVSMYVCLFCSD